MPNTRTTCSLLILLTSFSHEACDAVGVLRLRIRQDQLDDNPLVQLQMARCEHHAHAATPHDGFHGVLICQNIANPRNEHALVR